MRSTNLTIDGDRLWESLMEMAKIGATASGGVCRLALTDLDRQARELFIDWCRKAGCTISVDQMGNIFARREGRDPEAAPVLTGSHIDTQPTGGRFDGVYGVLAGLEVIRTLDENGYVTRAPVEVVIWTNEEGTRFPPAMLASGVFAGVFSLDFGLSRIDRDGLQLKDELARIGYAGETPVGRRQLKAYIEAHIEQGPILEAESKTIGVVTGAQGQRWYEVTITGEEAHAGPTPMRLRHDALVAAARAVLEVNEIGIRHDGCSTVGLLNVHPNSRNTIPGQVFMTVDLRHPDDKTLLQMNVLLRTALDQISRERGVSIRVDEIWNSPAVEFDRACVDTVRRTAEQCDFPSMAITSGAGHDACYLSRVAPSGMIFVPCKDGISHNEAESASPSDVAAGAQVLLRTILELADN